MSSYCPQCGNLVVPGAQHCTQCGATLSADVPTTVQPAVPPAVVPPGMMAGPPTAPPGAPPPGSFPTPGAPGGEPPKPGPNIALIVAVAVLATLVVVGLVALLLTRSGGDDDPVTTLPPETLTTPSTSTTTSTTTTSTSTTTSTTSTTSTTTTTAPPPVTPVPTGDVLDQPAGLLCRDLESRGFSYSAAVDYWRFHGQPERMDADRNGIPCETVFPRSDVIAYWGATPQDEFNSLPAGLMCADLADRGFSYADAVAYWFATGAPDRMDADLNGIPCETVYSGDEIDFYWFG